MFSVIILYSEASGESCLNVKSGPGSNFILLEHALLTLTSFSLILLVAPLGFCSRSVPPSFSQSVPAPNRSWFSLIYNVAPLLLLRLYCYLATYLRKLLALRRSRRPFVAPLIILSLQGLRSITRQYASSFNSWCWGSWEGRQQPSSAALYFKWWSAV